LPLSAQISGFFAVCRRGEFPLPSILYQTKASESVSRNRTLLITAGIMLSLFLASMESTVVSTAAPTIVSQLGGIDHYSWIFSAYMLTSTVTVPVFGKLSDLYGRRSIFAAAMGIFLIGSILCGLARSMEQLIFFRAIQGFGAGGVAPLAFIIIGDIYSLEQRAKMQGFFSGVWGVSSVVGPLLGGFIVDRMTWDWIFYINIVPCIVALAIVWVGLDKIDTPKQKAAPKVDYLGAMLLMGSVTLLLLGLMDLQSVRGWGLIMITALLFVWLYRVERRASDPILPLKLFKERLFAVGCAHGILAGWAMFGSISFVPLFVQGVLGTNATEAGAAIMPLMLGWVFASIIGSRLLLRMNYRLLASLGMILLVTGTGMMAFAGDGATRLMILFALGLMGVGMGLSVPAFLIAIQTTVERKQLGTATSTIQFARSIGGTLGVSIMGLALNLGLVGHLRQNGIDPESVSINSLITPHEGGVEQSVTIVDEALRNALASGIQYVFIIAFVGALLGLFATLMSPNGRLDQIAAKQQASQRENAPDETVSPPALH
jgi:EmrB/QacA subfamily drug resistance transporter